PVQELKGFEKIGLEPGETETVTFTLTPEHLALYNRYLERVVEPGEFKIMVGSSSRDIRLSGELTVN
ncbi:fibronectin type III-like domain-contianing protein, partial [candidate division KSB1 bacterium]|nr:fibronectin type III-like domain-contianing protein [candidate division KSB1 bacterium]